VNESVVGRRLLVVGKAAGCGIARSRPGGDAGNGIQIKTDLETEYHFL
jgi:hypothetical protein